MQGKERNNKSFKMASYNVNSINTRKDLVLSWLERDPVDILCLQELKTTDENFPREDFMKMGYECYTHGQKTYNGVAICSRFPLEEVFKGMGDATYDQEKRVIGGRFKDVWIINAYFPHGEPRGGKKFFWKLGFYERFLGFLTEHFSPNDKIVLVGDMNVAMEDIDVYDPVLLKDTIGTMKEERDALKKLISWGFVDAFRYLYPEKKQFTWWDYIGGMVWKDQGMRIDYILITKPLLPYLRDVYVDMWPRKRRNPKPSDHAPIVGVFEL
ncbi:MAG: exodeoxyribonuclease III [Hydrogenobacter thermophilus]|uniref:exodeoxyribonuclease III n=1 Tax=Hydrogenobacter thermophilus TaxID=940 RepID=UPI001C74D131|nr:exodeoxyribonuclease III [Hydrogenobacter thermophilus]QWK20056.1 MAG: exodeoxyribonuclease III [Hydrogenobacter thermophilus]